MEASPNILMKKDNRPRNRVRLGDIVVTPVAHPVPVAAKLLSIGKSKLWQMIADKEVKSIAIGARRLIPQSEIDRILKSAA